MQSSQETKVSIIITTFKRANMIRRAINSVLNQSYKNIEIIVVDDNNAETEYRKETEKIMGEYRNEDRLKYIKHEKNKNGAAARNTGIVNSSGEVICFLDDDDQYSPNKIELQLNYLKKNMQFDAVYCGWIRDNKVIIPKLEGDLSFELLSGIGLIYTNTIMMWKNVAITIGGWDERFLRNQEAVFLLRFFKNNHKIGVVSKVLVEFNIDDRSNVLDAKRNKEQIDLYLDTHEDLIDECGKKLKNARKIIYSYRYRGILLSFIKSKDIVGAVSIYLSMMKYIPFRFNKDLIIYFFKKIIV